MANSRTQPFFIWLSLLAFSIVYTPVNAADKGEILKEEAIYVAQEFVKHEQLNTKGMYIADVSKVIKHYFPHENLRWEVLYRSKHYPKVGFLLYIYADRKVEYKTWEPPLKTDD